MVKMKRSVTRKAPVKRKRSKKSKNAPVYVLVNGKIQRVKRTQKVTKNKEKVEPDDDLLALRNQVLQQKAEKVALQRKQRNVIALRREKKKLKKQSRKLTSERTTVGGAKRNLARAFSGFRRR